VKTQYDLNVYQKSPFQDTRSWVLSMKTNETKPICYQESILYRSSSHLQLEKATGGHLQGRPGTNIKKYFLVNYERATFVLGIPF
jgi:hypothetical protein